MCARPGALPTCAALFSPLWSREAGVAQRLASFARQAFPAFDVGTCPDPRCVTSCACGVVHNPAANSSALRLKSLFPAALFPSRAGVPAIGVGQSAPVIMSHATPAKTSPCVWPCDGARCVVRFSCSDALAVGHDEDPEPFMRRACFSRAECACRTREAQSS